MKAHEYGGYYNETFGEGVQKRHLKCSNLVTLGQYFKGEVWSNRQKHNFFL